MRRAVRWKSCTEQLRTGLRALLILGATFHGELAHSAVAFAAGWDEHTGSLTPLLVMAALVYALAYVIRLRGRDLRRTG